MIKHFVVITAGVFLSINSFAALLTACGEVEYNSNQISCSSTSIIFNIADCEPHGGKIKADKVSCENSELVATVKTTKNTYRAVFNKNYSGQWSQKGKVWMVSLKKEVRPTKWTSVATVQTVEPTKIEEKHEHEEVKKEPVESSAAPATTENKTEISSLPSNSESWSYKFGGWIFFENESFTNFGEGLNSATIFNSNSTNSYQTNTNFLADIQFSASKGPILFDSIYEIGTVYFGDSQTGGNQGARGKIVEVRNFYVQEELQKKLFFKIGLWSVLSDPRGFILSDNYAGAQVRYEDDNYNSQLWYAVASDSRPNSITNRDSYVGLLHTQKYFTDSVLSLFFTARGTRETFVDDDLVSYSGKSTYNWLGFNNINKKIYSFLNLETGAIIGQAKFSADSGPTDNNTSSLIQAKVDFEAMGGYNFALEGVATSGSADSRTSSNKKILGRRKNFASPNPSSIYLLTVATNDGGDDGPGSVRSHTDGEIDQIGRLDTDEGLQIAVASVGKSFGDKLELLTRYGVLKSTVKRTLTDSNDYGSEYDFVFKYHTSKMTTWVIEYGSFKPGGFFVSRDSASLLSLRYRLDF